MVGCNGAGKTTLLLNIKEECSKQKIPYYMFDNLQDGGSLNVLNSILSGYKEFEGDDIPLAVNIWSSSEGEAIKLNIARQSSLYKEFLRSGYFKNRQYNFNKIFKEPKEITSNKRVFLFDATDSGMSIDAICEIKTLFNAIQNNAEELGLELYIIISANEYELCRNENCFDVNDGLYLQFNDYEDYRRFILKSRDKKENRIIKQIAWREKQRTKELSKGSELISICEEKKQKLLNEYGDKKLNWEEKYKLEEVIRPFKDFLRYARFVNKEDFEFIKK